MPRAWFFQANPNLYDVDSALRELDRIWWRVPQYTADIAPGDVVAIWRSGGDAGIVGLGRVVAEPRERATPEDEQRFVVDPEVAGSETRVPLAVKAVPHVPKDDVRSLPGFVDHSIIKAPLGTVIPIGNDDWGHLRRLVQEDPPPLSSATETSDLPAPFSWEQRAKSAHPMPGGYDKYLDSLATLLDRIDDERPTREELPMLIRETFDVSQHRSSLLAAFLRKAGFVTDQGAAIDVSGWSRRWQETGDARVPVALLHSRIRFVGELLAAARQPRSTSELLDTANREYDCRWSTKAQIDRRRGWLQSAGMLTIDEANRLLTTGDGTALLGELTLHEPPPRVQRPEHVEEARGETTFEPEQDPDVGGAQEAMVAELLGSALDSSDPNRFERAVRDAFAWLGFDAEWLGGAGRTDVLLDAPLGKGQSYRVIVDCKTSGGGSVSDHQVDWITLSDHRKKHDADYVALVAPSPSGQRLFERAREQQVTVIAADELATLCEQHATAPLDLEAYRSLFNSSGSVDTEAVAERAEDWLHVVGLARAVIETVAHRADRFGELTAEGILHFLADDPVAESVSLEDLQSVLDTLAGPLLGLLAGDADHGYRLVTPRPVARLRLGVLARSLWSHNADG